MKGLSYWGRWKGKGSDFLIRRKGRRIIFLVRMNWYRSSEDCDAILLLAIWNFQANREKESKAVNLCKIKHFSRPSNILSSSEKQFRKWKIKSILVATFWNELSVPCLIQAEQFKPQQNHSKLPSKRVTRIIPSFVWDLTVLFMMTSPFLCQ